MEKFFGTYRDCTKAKKAQILVCIALCPCAIAVQHEQWTCLGMQRHTHTLCNLVTI